MKCGPLIEYDMRNQNFEIKILQNHTQNMMNKLD